MATGAAAPRSVTRLNLKGEKETSAAEKFMAPKTIERLLRDVEIDHLAALVETLGGLSTALQSIKATTIEHVGFEKAIELPKLDKLVREMTEFAHAALVTRDPTLAPQARRQLRGARRRPRRLRRRCVRDARRRRRGARLGARLFRSFRADQPGAALDPPSARDVGQEPLRSDEAAGAAARRQRARVRRSRRRVHGAGQKPGDAPSAALAQPPSEPAASRAAALALIDAVAQHMQRAEPSSPAPYLLDRARNLASRDFLSLFHDVLPDEAIAALKKGK